VPHYVGRQKCAKSFITQIVQFRLNLDPLLYFDPYFVAKWAQICAVGWPKGRVK